MTARTTYRQCDLERAIRAARATGAGAVTVRPDGTIVIEAEPVDSGNGAGRRKPRLAKAEEVVFS